tara:strand:+ start:1355 stop:1561 length:207 start_codon:yes stop_codon:yes gene_type:complete
LKLQNLKDEIYKYVANFDLTEEEIKHIDTYVNDLIEFLSPLLKSNNKILEDEKAFAEFKKILLLSLGE